MRIAAIDIGTNSIHMVIARATHVTGFEVVDRERDVVQIGRGSWERGRLRPEAIQRAVDALTRYVELARRQQVDHILCTATAAVREARNGGDFIQKAREATGILPRVIPAEEEGRLIYLGVKRALELPDGNSLMVDIGGGSAQLVVGDRERCLHTAGVPLGSLRLTETLLREDPPSRRDLQRLRRHVRRHSRKALEAVKELSPVEVFGSSGVIHSLAEASHWMETGQPIGMINGYRLRLEPLRRLARRLQRMPLPERIRMPGIDARRAEIIVPGATVLLHMLDAVGAEAIVVSDFGVREGMVTDYITSHPREMSTLESEGTLRLRSALQLLARFPLNEKHARHVAMLSLALFDALRRDHELDDEARELLHYAALLHDVGAVLGYDSHGEHSYYIIRNGNLRGFNSGEVEIVASVARFHGQRRPRKRVLAELGLGKKQRRLVRWLAAILRVAEGLDRSHYQLVRSVRVRRSAGTVSILVETRRDSRLELWASRRRTDLLERLLEARVRIVPDRAVTRARAQRVKRVRKPALAARRPTVVPLAIKTG